VPVFKVIIYHPDYLFNEMLTIVFINVPIEKFGFANAIACFIQNVPQCDFMFTLVFYFYFVNHARGINVNIG
jgi:hypothetical protein